MLDRPDAVASGPSPAPPPPSGAWRRLVVAVVAILALVVLTACQTHVDVHVKVADDGSGAVTVGVGLDDEALARVGDLGAQLRVDDLRAAGWTVTGPAKEDDGITWVRASKPFADPAGARAVLDEVNGADGAFGGWTVKRSSSPWATTWSVDGQVDLSSGAATFGDAALDQALGGDGLGGAVRALEQEQGRPVAELVDVRVTVEVPGRTTTYTPVLGQAPTTVAVSSSQRTQLVTVVVLAAVVGMIALVAGLIWRQRRRRRRGLTFKA